MKLIKTARCSEIRDRLYAFRTTTVLLPLGALLVTCSAGSLFAQINPVQLMDRNSSSPQIVSRNQLLAPVKASRAIDRAHKDILDGHLDSAQKEINRAIDIAPHFAAAKVLQGAIDLETKNYERATNFFQQAIDDDPALGGAYVGMAMVLIHQGRFQAALPLLEHAEGLLPGAWFVRFAEAWAHLELGNTEAALKQADYAERMAGTDSEKRSGVSYLRAMVFTHINDMDTARLQLAEAVALGHGCEYAALAQRELERLQPLLAARQ